MFSGIGGFEYGIEQSYNEYAHECKKSEQKECSQRREWSSNQQRTQLCDRNGTTPLCVGYSEIDKYAKAIYKYHYPNHTDYGDITKINADKLPEFDMLVGGFPYQAFSIAGKRKGFNDTRGTLFFDIARIIKAKRPKIVLLENVKGLLSHDKGKTFRIILQTLGELGYDTQWMVLNSKFFGVPQNRERTFIIGSIRGSSRPEILPLNNCNGKTNKIHKVGNLGNGHEAHNVYSKEGIAPTVRETHGKVTKVLNNPVHSNDRLYDSEGVSPSLNTAQGGNRQPKIVGMHQQIARKRVHETPVEINEYFREKKNNPLGWIAEQINIPKTQLEHYFRTDESRAIPDPETYEKLKKELGLDDRYDEHVKEFYEKEVEFESTRRIYGDEGISPTISSTNADKLIRAVLTPDRLEKRQNGRRFKDEEEPSFTLTGQDKHGVSNGTTIRRLTPTECERLQGFPDDWTKYGNFDGEIKEISDTQRYKTLGNAVSTTVVSAIIERMYGD